MAVLLQLTWLLDDNGIPANWADMVRVSSSLKGYRIITMLCMHSVSKLVSKCGHSLCYLQLVNLIC